MVDDPHTPGEQTVRLSELVEEIAELAPAGEQNPACAASGDDEAKATTVSPVLDDPRSIEDGPEEERRVNLGCLSIQEIERLRRQGKRIGFDDVTHEAYEVLPVPARDHAAGRLQRGSPDRLPESDSESDPEPELPVDRADGQLQQGQPDRPPKPEPEPPVDRAAEIPQQGVEGNPDPRSLNSGMLASEIAAVAYGTVQSYKSRVGQQSVPWIVLSEVTRTQITLEVRRVMSEGIGGPAANHETWRKNMLERGRTVEDDPRVGQAWGDLEPVERRKAMIFTQVVMALLREV